VARQTGDSTTAVILEIKKAVREMKSGILGDVLQAIEVKATQQEEGNGKKLESNTTELIVPEEIHVEKKVKFMPRIVVFYRNTRNGDPHEANWLSALVFLTSCLTSCLFLHSYFFPTRSSCSLSSMVSFRRSVLDV